MTLALCNRRAFLQSAGVCLALPLLESVGARGATTTSRQECPRRMVAICFTMGVHGPNLFPGQAGRGYTPTPYLRALGRDLLPEVTVFSGLSHPDVTLGHASDVSFLTAAPHPGGDTFRNTISLDQQMVELLKPSTRIASLTLGTSGNGTLSFSRTGVPIPAETRPSALFASLFVNGSKSEKTAQIRRLKEGQSVLDALVAPTKRLYKHASTHDRNKILQYYTAIREVENDLLRSQQWAEQPKPKVNAAPPLDITDRNDSPGKLKLLLGLVYLALQSDSTRFVTLLDDGNGAIPPLPGVTMEYHTLCHHGQEPEKIAQLSIVQAKQMEHVGEFLRKLQQSTEGDQTILARTMVMFGSAMGNASNHTCTNLPIMLAGGGFRHGQHIAFDATHNLPLARLYVSMMQRLEIDTDIFASGRGALPGLALT